MGIKQESLDAKGSSSLATVPTWVLSAVALDSFIIIRSFSRDSALNPG